MLFNLFVLTLLVLFVKRKKVDVIFVAFISCAVYFSPAYFGYVIVGNQGSAYLTEIESILYLIYTCVFIAIYATALTYDRIFSMSTVANTLDHLDRQKIPLQYEVVVFTLGIISCLIFVTKGWPEIIGSGKPDFGFEHTLIQAVLPLSFLLALYNRKLSFGIFFALIILIDLYAGNREILVFTAIGSGIIILNNKEIGVKRYIYALGLGATAYLIVLFYKTVYQAIKDGNWALVKDRITSFEHFNIVIVQSEPFITQGILNEVVLNRYEYFNNYFLDIVYVFLPMAQVFGYEQKNSITSYINNSIFSNVEYGVASNIWAEMYLVGGLLLVVISIIMYCFFAFILNYMIQRRTGLSILIYSQIACIVMFFIHRAGLLYSMTLLSRILWISIFILVAAYILSHFTKKSNVQVR